MRVRMPHLELKWEIPSKYFASFDSDFARAKDIITEDTGMTVLTKPKEILDIL